MADHTPPTDQQLGGQHGYDCPPSVPADRDALRNRIAEVLAVRFTADGDISQGMRVIDSDGEEDTEPARRVRPVEAADAIMPVLPPPTDRAAVLLEAADDLAEFIALHGPTSRTVAGWRGAVGFLRRMADEAQQQETTPARLAGILAAHTDSLAATIEGFTGIAASTIQPGLKRTLDFLRLYREQLLAGQLSAEMRRLLGRLAAEVQQPACAECSHPKDVHREGDDPVSPGQCSACEDDFDWHDYQEA